MEAGGGGNGPGSQYLLKTLSSIRPHFLKVPTLSSSTASKGLLTHELCRSSQKSLPVKQEKCMWMASC